MLDPDAVLSRIRPMIAKLERESVAWWRERIRIAEGEERRTARKRASWNRRRRIAA